MNINQRKAGVAILIADKVRDKADKGTLPCKFLSEQRKLTETERDII